MAGKADSRKRDVNFFAELSRQEAVRKTSVNRSKLGIISIICATVISISGYAGWMIWNMNARMNEVVVVQAYLSNEENQSVYTERSRLRGTISQLQEYNDACEQYINQIKELPRIDNNNFSEVYQRLPEGVQVTAYSFANPVLTVQCITESKDAPAKFAENLSASGVFKMVAYEGFSSEEALGNRKYTFQIQCTLW